MLEKIRIFCDRWRTLAWISSAIRMAWEALRSNTYADLSSWNSITACEVTRPIEILRITNIPINNFKRKLIRFMDSPIVRQQASVCPDK